MNNFPANMLRQIKRKVFGKNVPTDVVLDGMQQNCVSRQDFDEFTRQTIQRVSGYTLTSPERLSETIQATRYISLNNIGGSIVECGVWKGGSVLAIISTLMSLNDTSREIYLFDTFQGMTEPDNRDVSINGVTAGEILANENPEIEHSVWCKTSLEGVKAVIGKTAYPQDKIHFVRGKVEDTIPGKAPSKIALLRLDTDWYASTAHELLHLYPRVSKGGIVIIDDYGHWQGARKAVDDFLSTLSVKPFLARTDYTGRICTKPD